MDAKNRVLDGAPEGRSIQATQSDSQVGSNSDAVCSPPISRPMSDIESRLENKLAVAVTDFDCLSKTMIAPQIRSHDFWRYINL